MQRNFKRTDRIAETIMRELAQIIQREMTEPNLPKFITISAVKVSKDLSHAKVYFTVLNADPVDTAIALNMAAGYLRMLLAKAIKLRVMPQLHFVYDESIEYGKNLSNLINKVNPSDSNDEQSE